MKIAGVVLAGGQSKRMGTDKTLLKIGNKTLLQHSQQILKSAGIKDVFISGDKNIQDSYINKGPIAGIYSCLEYLIQYNSVLFIPVDMPLLNNDALLNLINHQYEHAIYYKNQQFPAIIKNNIINRKIIKQQLDSDRLSVRNILSQLEAQSIKCPFQNNVFTNTNTEKDWLMAIESLNQHRSP